MPACSGARWRCSACRATASKQHAFQGVGCFLIAAGACWAWVCCGFGCVFGFASRGRDSPRRATPFSCACCKKRKQKKHAPAARIPFAGAKGQPAVLRRGAVPRNSLRAARFAQTDAASQITKRVCPSAHAPAPRPALLGTARRGLKPHAGHRCARPPTRRRCAPRSPGRAQRWPVSSPPPFRLRLGRGGGGVACAKSRMLRGLTRCGCLSEARSAQRVASSAAHPASVSPQVCPVAQRRGRRLRGAFLCLLSCRATRKEVARRGESRPREARPQKASKQPKTLSRKAHKATQTVALASG